MPGIRRRPGPRRDFQKQRWRNPWRIGVEWVQAKARGKRPQTLKAVAGLPRAGGAPDVHLRRSVISGAQIQVARTVRSQRHKEEVEFPPTSIDLIFRLALRVGVEFAWPA